MSRAARLIALFAVVSFLAAGVPALAAPPSEGHTHTPNLWSISIGQDEEFQGFNYGYRGIGEGDASCIDANDQLEKGICRMNINAATSHTFIEQKATTTLPLGHQARAGVGLYYDVNPGCIDQVMPSGDDRFQTTFEYRRSATVANGASAVDLYVHSTEGRGDLALPENVQNQKAEPTLRASSAEAAKSTTFKRSIPADGVHHALLYSHAQGGSVPPLAGTRIEAKADVTLDKIKFHWVDTAAPTSSFERLSQGDLVMGHDGREYVRADILINIDTDDDFSCPRAVKYRPDYQAPIEEKLVNFLKQSVQFTYTAPGKYNFGYYAEDHQGNRENDKVYVFGIDPASPVVTFGITPTAPSASGWYLTKPTISLACTDDVSGCYQMNWTYGTGGWQSTYATTRVLNNPPEGTHMFVCQAEDKAKRFGACAGVPNPIRIDSVAPTIQGSPTCTAQGVGVACSTSWHKVPVTFQLAPCFDATSQCAPRKYRIDAGPLQTFEGPVTLSSDGDHAISMYYADQAGHSVFSSFRIKIDQTAPGLPSLTEVLGRPSINADPHWQFPATDATSGVKDYTPTLNGNVQPAQASSDLINTNALDGEHCLSVSARDNALNVGPTAGPSCVLVDKLAPVVQMSKPKANVAYRYDQPIEIQESYSGAPIVIGSITLESSAADPAPSNGATPSGLVTHHTLLSGDPNWRGIGANECPLAGATCSHAYSPADPFAAMGTKTFSVVARDAAGSETRIDRQFKFVTMFALPGVTAGVAPAPGTPYVHTEWLELPSDGFVRYEVHRAPVAGFTPTPATQVFSTTDHSQIAYRDKAVVVGTTMYYKVVFVTEVAGGTVTRVSNEFAATPAAS